MSSSVPSDHIFNVAKERGFNVDKVPGDPASCWVLKALDPASEKVGPLTGIPDLNNEATVTLEWRQIDQLAPPAGLVSSDTWDLEMVTFPGPYLLGAVRSKKSSASDFDPVNFHLIMNKRYNFASTQPANVGGLPPISGGDTGKWPTDVAGYRVMYSSSTGTFNGADLSNQGTLVAGQLPTNYIFDPLINVAADVVSGTEVQGQAPVTQWLKASVKSPAPGYDGIMQTCPRAELFRAKKGWYIPCRLTNVSANTPFQPSNALIADMTDPWFSGSLFYLQNFPEWFPIPIPANAQLGVIGVRGLAPTSTFTVTSRVGFECTIEASTSFQSFVTPSCPPDFALVQEYARINSLLGDVYPSDYNSKDILGLIIEQLAAHMPAPWDTILPVVAKAGRGIYSAATGKPKQAKKRSASEMMGKTKQVEQPQKKTFKNTSSGIKGVPSPIRRIVKLTKND